MKNAVFVIFRFLAWVLTSLMILVSCYLVLIFVTDTPEERELQDENRSYKMAYAVLAAKESRLSSIIDSLKTCDDSIYYTLFHVNAPAAAVRAGEVIRQGADTLLQRHLVKDTRRKLLRAEKSAAIVKSDFARVLEIMSDSSFIMPPMKSPLPQMSYAQVGASSGVRLNPFYKVSVGHNGLDIIAGQGSEVYVSAPGIVVKVERSRKGHGNTVTVSHGRYVTKYSHLGDIKVKAGQRVNVGTQIGSVGMSGYSFVPHLHYEVWRDTLVMNPVNHLFASFGPEEYSSVAMLGEKTVQSLD